LEKSITLRRGGAKDAKGIKRFKKKRKTTEGRGVLHGGHGGIRGEARD